MADKQSQSMTKAQLIAEIEKLKHREALFEAIERVAQIGRFEWDYEKSRLRSCSKEYAAIFNMSVEEVMAAQASWEKVLEQIHPEDLEQYRNNVVLLSDDESVDFKYRIVRNDGQIRHIHEIDIIDIKNNGEKLNSFGLLQDITDLHEHERDLEYRDTLSQQAEAITEIGHFIFDEKNEHYLFVSPGLARIYGVSSEEYMRNVQSTEDDLADVYDEDRERLEDAYEQFNEDAKDFSMEYRLWRADGELRWVRELNAAQLFEDGKVVHSLGVMQDITARKNTEMQLLQAKETLEATVEERTLELADTVLKLQDEIVERNKIAAELEFLANHDALTGLPSLRLCKDRLDRSLADSRRSKQMSVVLFLDLDGFKEVNDTYGHEYGDIVLKTTADRIKAEIRETDTVARIGGDEFVIILSRIPDQNIIKRVAANVIAQISQFIQIGNNEITIGASIGIAVYPEDGTTSDTLIRQADQAMYLIKRSGKNNFGFAHSSLLN